jgi:signal transduction histidine kinase
MVSDLLELSMAEGGTLSVRPVPTSVPDLLRQLVGSYEAEAKSRCLNLALELESTDLQIVTDPQRVTQILQNLISNALKYTPPEGAITVSAALQTPSDGADTPEGVTIDVADTGLGIPEDQVANVFDEFTRLETHKGLPGSGLGLAIARRVALLLGGNLTLASSPAGSTFTLWLPPDRRSVHVDSAPSSGDN